MGTEYRPEKFFGYRWIPGTDQISIHAEPWLEC